MKKSKNTTKKKATPLKSRATTVPKLSSTGLKSKSMSVTKTSRNTTDSVKKSSVVASQSLDKKTKTIKKQASSVKNLVKPMTLARKSSLPQVRRKDVSSRHPVDREPLSSDELRALLLERRNGILKNFDCEMVTAREISSPPVSGDAADIAQDASENELTIQLAEVESRELFQINMAL
ncbi:MAG: hypothetical protein FWD31_13440, partial [Planctomycetaceae bacterium]|nr:hypothetical protein [Planctomycetaceae bacterium]